MKCELGNLLPRDLKLFWDMADENEQLNYAITQNGQPALTGDVSDSKADFDQHGNPSVSMTMNTRRTSLGNYY